MSPVLTPEIAISGAGIIGLSLALELHARGASVVLLDRADAGGGASRAAAGMLAVDDPHNLPALHPLSAWSMSLYDDFLRRVEALSARSVPYQTVETIQYQDDGTTVLRAERSVDPRQLTDAALKAIRCAGIPLPEHCGQLHVSEETSDPTPRVSIRPEHGPAIRAGRLVHTSGAWFAGTPRIVPRKGQMLRVQIPRDLDLHVVHRSASVYIVPRTHGPQAGSALIGATEEDAGFDLQTWQPDLDALRARAAALVHALGSPQDAPQIEAWAGLRPTTADRLPVIGPLPRATNQWIASGHHRNGILLAPATAVALADMLENKSPKIDLRPFDPARPL